MFGPHSDTYRVQIAHFLQSPRAVQTDLGHDRSFAGSRVRNCRDALLFQDPYVLHNSCQRALYSGCFRPLISLPLLACREATNNSSRYCFE